MCTDKENLKDVHRKSQYVAASLRHFKEMSNICLYGISFLYVSQNPLQAKDYKSKTDETCKPRHKQHLKR